MNILENTRKKQWLVILFTFFCISISSAQASESKYHPFVKGSFSQIQQQYKDSTLIIAFWSETCAYCMKELALFGRVLKQYPQVKLVTITTDPFLEDETVEHIMSSRNLGNIETWVFADNFAERLYYDINPRWRGELPLTYFSDRNNKMIKHMGEVTEAELLEWIKDQSAGENTAQHKQL